MTTSRGAPAPITVTITAITTVRITVTILVNTRVAPTAVTITALAIVPVVTITVITAFSTTIVRITVGRTTVSHILARGGSVRPISYGIVDADPAAIQVDAIQFIDALRGFFDSTHSDKAKATRPVGLV